MAVAWAAMIVRAKVRYEFILRMCVLPLIPDGTRCYCVIFF